MTPDVLTINVVIADLRAASSGENEGAPVVSLVGAVDGDFVGASTGC